MGDGEQQDPDLDLEDLDDDIDGTERSTGLFVAAIVAALLIGIGAVGYLSGLGWFGYRQWLYGSGEVYLGNYTADTHRVSVDGRDPVELGPHKYEIVDLVGGTSTIRIMDAAGETLSVQTVTTDQSDAYVKVAGEACLVASDVTPFYRRGEGELEFLEMIEKDQRTWVPASRNVIWPGESFPPQLDAGDGPGVWIEKVGCAHLEDPQVMRGYLQVRLRDRLDLGPKRMGAPK